MPEKELCFLRISRPSDDSHFIRKYSIFIDGSKKAKISVGGSIDLAVPPGIHTVEATLDFFWRSQPIQIELFRGMITELKVFGTSKIIGLFYGIFYPQDYLSLERERIFYI